MKKSIATLLLAAQGSTDFASSFAKREKAALKMLERLIKDFDGIE